MVCFRQCGEEYDFNIFYHMTGVSYFSLTML
nr:MAG TPA: hypothetical protein [Caudoviricetes sp.]